MATVLANLPGYINTPMMDPIYGISRVNKALSQVELIEPNNRVRGDGLRAADALKWENSGYDDAAISKWKEIFLSGFPK